MNTSKIQNLDVKTEIQMTLRSIFEITSKIKRELGQIKDLTNENGQLCTAVADANATLSEEVKRSGGNLEDIVKNKDQVKDSDILSATASAVVIKKLAEFIKSPNPK